MKSVNLVNWLYFCEYRLSNGLSKILSKFSGLKILSNVNVVKDIPFGEVSFLYSLTNGLCGRSY